MTERTPNDWKRLGRAVKRARFSRPEYRKTQAWASAVGRSTRIVLGLERGEVTGDETLLRIEQLLGWPADYAWRILDNTADEPPAGALTGDEIRAARIARGLDLGELAALVGVAADVISRWEAGQPVAPARAERLREVLFDVESDSVHVETIPDTVLLTELLRRAHLREGNGRQGAAG